MTIQNLKSDLKDYAKDIKVNLGNIISKEVENSPLSQKRLAGVALSSAFAIKNNKIIDAIIAEFSEHLDETYINACKTAATTMAMNNIYYRFVHLVGDKDYSTMPAGLRMQSISNHGIDKIDFEFFSIAVSVINGCGMCIESHANQLLKHGISKQEIQQCAKIAAVINATNQAIFID